ncbi:N-acetylglucosaminyltransferase [Aspergillus alliaceus]|uniref:N-acetylglucosaminyltransferase n=1 Tax=Petromyces alliaceus TaxID=209559 RepID=A0A8H6E5S4_PETAA|nr:N-acetylglucosaminyltransferase [Aspergillus burnettii]
MAIKKVPRLPHRRGSQSSEDDFFDIPDEPCLAILKRQLRRIRTWVVFALFALFIIWFRLKRPQPSPLPHINYDLVDWSRYAYSQYATSSAYLCNSVMVFEALHRLGSRAQRVLFFPEDWDVTVESERDRDSQLLAMARDKFNVMLIPIDMAMIKPGAGPGEPWDKSISKLLAFGESEYDRIIHLDSDANILQNLDELFFLPPNKVAMPRAYWALPDAKQLSSLLIVIEPSYSEYNALMEAALPAMYGQKVVNTSSTHRYDMELLNERYVDSATVLPHRQYGLVSGEFRAEDHRNFLGNDYEVWDPDKVLSEAKLVHFSDWPLPKPWVMWPQKLLAEMLPKCKHNPGTPQESGCRDREVWKSIYHDFRRRRKDICKLLSYPAPDWPPTEHPGSSESTEHLSAINDPTLRSDYISRKAFLPHTCRCRGYGIPEADDRMTTETAKNGDDTTCGVEIDRSNYWISQLCHKTKDELFEKIEYENSAIDYFNRACNYSPNATSCDGTKYLLVPPAGLSMVAENLFLQFEVLGQNA